jgi:hypothetical protein
MAIVGSRASYASGSAGKVALWCRLPIAIPAKIADILRAGRSCPALRELGIMATTQNSPTPANTPAPEGGNAAPAALNDSDIIISVSGTGADSGYRYVAPAPKLPASLSPELGTAAYSGWYREMISPAQSAATKARKGDYKVDRVEGEGENAKTVNVALGEREAVQHFVDNFKPSANRELPTVGNKRLDIAKEMLGKALAARGEAVTDAALEANLGPWMAGPKGSGDNARQVDAALRAFLATAYTVTKRGAGKSADGAAPTAKVLSWDE